MKSMPTVENAATWFNAKTDTHHYDVIDRQTASIVDTRTVEGSTVRFYNACGFKFMTLKSDDVQVGPTCKFGRRITAVDVEYGPANVTVSLIAPFAELVTATRPYSEDEADYLL